MNEEYNPYIKSGQDNPPQPPQDYYPPQSQDYYQQQQDYYRQQIYYPQPRQSGPARVFSIISFALGCLALVSMLFLGFSALYLDTSSVLDRFDFLSSMSDSSYLRVMGIAIPGLVFGIIALAKKTGLFTPGLLGVLFSGISLFASLMSALTSML